MTIDEFCVALREKSQSESIKIVPSKFYRYVKFRFRSRIRESDYFCPLTLVNGDRKLTISNYMRAGRELGLTSKDTADIMLATDSIIYGSLRDKLIEAVYGVKDGDDNPNPI